jgi:hypothetical protein
MIGAKTLSFCFPTRRFSDGRDSRMKTTALKGNQNGKKGYYIVKLIKERTAARILGASGFSFTSIPPRAGPITKPKLAVKKQSAKTLPKCSANHT